MPALSIRAAKAVFFAAIAHLFLSGVAVAQTSADAQALADRYFQAATQAERSEALALIESAAGDHNAARFVLGSARFFGAIERFAQALYRHGLETSGGAFSMAFRTPVPVNPQPEPLDYAGFRAILDAFHEDLDRARATLATVDANQPFKIVADMKKTRFDLTGADALPEQQNLLNWAIAMRFLRNREAEAQLELAYDNADAIWLEGYANVMMAQLDFVLAHDFQRAFDTTMHAFFPRAGLPLADVMVPDRPANAGVWDDWRIFDLVALIHLIDFEVVEPQRRAAVRLRLLEMVRLSRANWAAIRAETDADREWLPGPQQPDGHPIENVAVTEETAAAWLETLDLLERILNGEVLVPHPRFPGRGLNMRTYFEEGERFDLVLFVTGAGAVPYLEQGPVVDPAEWRRITRALGRRGFLGTAIWFN